MRRASDEEINSVLSVAPIENILMSAYDEFVEENARIRAEAGLKELIIREAVGGCCEWCSKLAGIFEVDISNEEIKRKFYTENFPSFEEYEVECIKDFLE